MSKKKENNIIVPIAVVGGLALLAYAVFGGGNKLTKEKAIEALKRYGHSGDLSGFGSDYLIAWAIASEKGQGTFQLDGKNYLTQTGKAV